MKVVKNNTFEIWQNIKDGFNSKLFSGIGSHAATFFIAIIITIAATTRTVLGLPAQVDQNTADIAANSEMIKTMIANQSKVDEAQNNIFKAILQSNYSVVVSEKYNCTTELCRQDLMKAADDILNTLRNL